MASEALIFANGDGMNIEYYAFGPIGGYPVLHMHGAVPMPFSEDLTDELNNRNIRVFLILRPGYGGSSPVKYKNVYEYAGMLSEFIQSYCAGGFDAMGLSAGAPYCYALAAAYPELIGGAHICAGIPLVNDKDIFAMNSRSERFLFSLSKYLPERLIGKVGVYAMEAAERKKGWKPAAWGESMDDVFAKYARPNRLGIGRSARLQYRYWGFDAARLTSPVYVYHSRADEMIPYRIAAASAERLLNGKMISLDGEEHASEKTIMTAVVTGIGK